MIKSHADVIKHSLQLERAITSPPDKCWAEWPHSYCIIRVKDKDNPTTIERIRVHARYAPNCRDVYFRLDKGFSRASAELAIPFLVNAINRSSEPGEAVRKFQLLVGDLDAAQPSVTVFDMGNTDEGGDGKLLRQCLEQLLDGSGEGNRGFGF